MTIQTVIITINKLVIIAMIKTTKIIKIITVMIINNTGFTLTKNKENNQSADHKILQLHLAFL